MFENHELEIFLHAFSLRKNQKVFERNGHSFALDLRSTRKIKISGETDASSSDQLKEIIPVIYIFYVDFSNNIVVFNKGIIIQFLIGPQIKFVKR